MKGKTAVTGWLALALVVLHTVGTIMLGFALVEQRSSDTSYLRLMAKAMCRGTR